MLASTLELFTAMHVSLLSINTHANGERQVYFSSLPNPDRFLIVFQAIHSISIKANNMNLELLQVRMVVDLSVSSQTRFSGIRARIGVHLSRWFCSIGSFEIPLHVSFPNQSFFPLARIYFVLSCEFTRYANP